MGLVIQVNLTWEVVFANVFVEHQMFDLLNGVVYSDAKMFTWKSLKDHGLHPIIIFLCLLISSQDWPSNIWKYFDDPLNRVTYSAASLFR